MSKSGNNEEQWKLGGNGHFLSDEDWHEDNYHNRNYKQSLTRIEISQNQKINEANQRIDMLLNDTKRDINNIKEEQQKNIDNLRLQIENSKIRVIETLALFVALFTFLSLQVQIFEGAPKDKTLPLILLSAGLLFLFILILDLIIRDDHKNDGFFFVFKFLLLTAISIGLIATGYLIYP